MERSPLHQQVDTLPDLTREMVDSLVEAAAAALPPLACRDLERVYITGCGDSHHAAVASELAFEQLAGVACYPMTAMSFGRYKASTLPAAGRGGNLLLAVSVSGQASRTVEAMRLGRLAGATGVAITGNRGSPLASEAETVLETMVPPLPDEMRGMIVPGSRSYMASLLALYLCAVHIGQQRGHLSKKQGNGLRRELAGMADLMEETIAGSERGALEAAAAWADADQFVFCGSGPNYGTAMFSAAKLLEASGDGVTAQDMEEWAHLQYFARQRTTPTFLISGGGRDESRAAEVAAAAAAIGRRVAAIAPAGSALSKSADVGAALPVAPGAPEAFSPMLTCLPGILFAAYRAQVINEPYFRDFGGGRSVEGGGGISRIRSSAQLDQLPDGS